MGEPLNTARSGAGESPGSADRAADPVAGLGYDGTSGERGSAPSVGVADPAEGTEPVASAGRAASVDGAASADRAAAEAGAPEGPGEDPHDDPDGKSRRARTQRPLWKELPVLVVVALVLSVMIKTFLVQPFSIPSGSMMNTLRIGDRVLVDKLTPHFGSGPSRGDVVVFRDPSDWLRGEPGGHQSGNSVLRGAQDALSWLGLLPSASEKDLIKRVIAVGGDTISCSGTGPVYVNGKPLDEPYLYPGATPCGDQNFGPLKVPAGSLWMMGDHRNDSSDSRYHMDEPGGGAVPESAVVGRAIAVAWPLTHGRTLPEPDTFAQPGIGAGASPRGSAGDGAGHGDGDGDGDGIQVSGPAVPVPAAVGLLGVLPITLPYRRRRGVALTRRSRPLGAADADGVGEGPGERAEGVPPADGPAHR
ncbi:signal peptidase I [Kitasatospora sp. NPDC050543]|uniref:signal peptidase I n=1 Tax=Kitasatospora sp. NPDC050543 TaxID=3364054 RepID=UPI0037A89293